MKGDNEEDDEDEDDDEVVNVASVMGLKVVRQVAPWHAAHPD